MDQSASLQGQDEVWFSKLAMLGCTVSKFNDYYFVHDCRDMIIRIGVALADMVPEVIEYLQHHAEKDT